MSWKELEDEIEKSDPEALRLFILSLAKRNHFLKERLTNFEMQDALEAQTRLELKEQLKTLQKMIFQRGREKRRSNDRKRLGEREQLLLHAEQMTPALDSEVESLLEQKAIIHRYSEEALAEVAARLGHSKDAKWETLLGLEETSQEISMIERRYIKILHERQKYRLKASKGSDREIIIDLAW